MARAGYCGACAANVYLDAGGACVNGHGPERITNAYEVPGARAPEPPPVPVAYAPSSAPAYAPAAPAPKKKRGGLIIALVLIALLLMCGCGVAGIVLYTRGSAVRVPQVVLPENTAARPRLQAGLTFLRAQATGDIKAFKSVMPSVTVKGVPELAWAQMLSLNAASPTTFSAPKWTGDSKVAVDYAGDGSKGALTLEIAQGAKLRAVLAPEASESEDATITLSQEPDGWKVLSLETPTGITTYDVATITALGK